MVKQLQRTENRVHLLSETLKEPERKVLGSEKAGVFGKKPHGMSVEMSEIAVQIVGRLTMSRNLNQLGQE